jgi:hypothetical protein
MPVLAGQTAAGAAVAQDADQLGVVYTDVGGDRLPCFIDAHHEVDTDTGELDVTLSAGCRGTLHIIVRRPDENGVEIDTITTARRSDFQSIHLERIGRTAVTVDYQIVIDDCTSTCFHTLQTKTK